MLELNMIALCGHFPPSFLSILMIFLLLRSNLDSVVSLVKECTHPDFLRMSRVLHKIESPSICKESVWERGGILRVEN